MAYICIMHVYGAFFKRSMIRSWESRHELHVIVGIHVATLGMHVYPNLHGIMDIGKMDDDIISMIASST
jgi:hypothetical protein